MKRILSFLLVAVLTFTAMIAFDMQGGVVFAFPGEALDDQPPDESHQTIEIFIDNVTARVNGKNATLDQPATVLNGRTVVPARFVAENLGATVGWDELENKVTITGSSYIGSSIRTYTDVTGVELYYQADGTETLSQYVYTYAADELEQYFAYLEDAGYQMESKKDETGLLTLTFTNDAYKGADELMLIIYNPKNASFSIFIFNK